MAKKTGLGSNLDSIFDDGDMFGGGGETFLKLSDIEPNKNQPRKNFSLESLNDLADSIRENGLIQPLIVRQTETGSYQLVAGERRWRASKIAGLTQVPVRIMELDDQQTAQIALIENLQREDLTPIEEAMGYQQLINQYGMKQEEVAKKVGKARTTVTNSLRILDLPEEVKDMARQGKLSRGQCKALLGVKDPLRQIELAHKAASGSLTVRQLENAGDAAKEKQAERKRDDSLIIADPFLDEAALAITSSIGYPCNVRSEKKGGIILEIRCKNDEELKELAARLDKSLGKYEN